MGANSEEIKVIRILCLGYTACFFLNLIFTLHNIFRYILGLKMKKKLILLFYSFLVIHNVLRIIEFCFRTAQPNNNFEPDESLSIFYLSSLALTTQIGIELILILTMHRLFLALRLINGKINKNQAKSRECIGLILTIIYACIYAAFQSYQLFQVSKNILIQWFFFFFTCSFIVLTLMYCIVITMLNRVLNQMVGDFKKEICSINCQFTVFLFAYVTRCLFLLFLESKTINEKFSTETIDFAYLIMAFFWQIVPSFTVLLLHY